MSCMFQDLITERQNSIDVANQDVAEYAVQCMIESILKSIAENPHKDRYYYEYSFKSKDKDILPPLAFDKAKSITAALKNVDASKIQVSYKDKTENSLVAIAEKLQFVYTPKNEARNEFN